MQGKEVFEAKVEIWEIDTDTGEQVQIEERDYAQVILKLQDEVNKLESELAIARAEAEGLKSENRTLRHAKRRSRVMVSKSVPSIEEQILALTE